MLRLVEREQMAAMTQHADEAPFFTAGILLAAPSGDHLTIGRGRIDRAGERRSTAKCVATNGAVGAATEIDRVDHAVAVHR
jgi:hypothetical protein